MISRQSLRISDVRRGNSVINAHMIANNTAEIRYANGDRAIRFWYTDIVTFKASGEVIYSSGGYYSLTTKERINEFSELQVYQRAFKWYFLLNGIEYEFHDGVTINHKEGRVIGFGRYH